MNDKRIKTKILTVFLMAGFICVQAGQAHALYVKPDPIQIIKKIEKERQLTAKVDNSQQLTANYSEIMDRLITIAAEKYGIIFIVQNDEQDFFSSKEG